MTIIESIMLITVIIIGMIACFAVPLLLIDWIDSIIEKIRKHKHPEYFDLYETAVSESFRIGGKLNEKAKYIEHYLKLYGDGYLNGECTKEDFDKKMQELIRIYTDACDDYNREYSKIKILLDKANAYAKEHGLKWGIIYN